MGPRSTLPVFSPQISDANKKRFEVPHEHIAGLNIDPTGNIGDVLEITNKPFGLSVIRKETKKVLWVLTMCLCAHRTFGCVGWGRYENVTYENSMIPFAMYTPHDKI